MPCKVLYISYFICTCLAFVFILWLYFINLIGFRLDSSPVGLSIGCYPVLPVFFKKGKRRTVLYAFPVATHCPKTVGVRFLTGGEPQ